MLAISIDARGGFDKVLTHRDGGSNERTGHDAPSHENFSRAGSGSPLVHKRGEGVEHKVLHHHLEDKHLCRVPRKRIAWVRVLACNGIIMQSREGGKSQKKN